VGEGGFPRSGDAGEADEEPERDFGVELADVVAGRAFDRQLRFPGLAAIFGDRDGFLAGEPGDRAEGREAGRLPHSLRRDAVATVNDVAAVLAGARADVDEVVGGLHNGLLVFHYDQRISLVAEAVHDADEAINVAWVEADGGFVEDEERAG